MTPTMTLDQAAIPELLRQRLLDQYGQETADSIVSGYVRRPVTLRANTLRMSIDEVKSALTAAGISFRDVSWYADALILDGVRESDVEALPLYQDGGVYLQNLSAMVPPLVLAPGAGEAILDMAAAPGGKTTQMAALSGNRCEITACEKNKIRAERLRFNLDKQGARRVTVMNTDARQLDDLFSFDKILLDAPCTGSGTILLDGTEPPRRMDPAWLKKIVATQTAMLTKALRLLKPGHEMVYSTCSILREENEGVLQQVLPHMNAEVLPITGNLAESLPLLPVTVPGTLCIRPDALHEGFFVARIRKKK